MISSISMIGQNAYANRQRVVKSRKTLARMTLFVGINLNPDEFTKGAIIIIAIFLCVAMGTVVFYVHSKWRTAFSSYRNLSARYRQLSGHCQQMKKQLGALRINIHDRTTEILILMLTQVQKTSIIKSSQHPASLVLELETRTDIRRQWKNNFAGLLNEKRDTEKIWQTFDIYFDRLHNGFSTSMKEKYPALTVSDLRLTRLLKLNLDIGQIAILMNSSTDSIKAGKYRLRRKLAVPADQDVQIFIMRTV